VPGRLALWVKAGGRTLPGLVKRRTVEGALFAGGVSSSEIPVPAANKSLWGVLAAALTAILEYFRTKKKEGS
jgi:hypothetical protein